MSGYDDFSDAYVDAALWSSTDDEGEPLDNNYTVDDIDSETYNNMMVDCGNFQRVNALALEDAYEIDEQDSANAGHNFWLTRNGHGAGFWDGDYPETGAELTESAKGFGEFDLYVGDDGKIYGSPLL